MVPKGCGRYAVVYCVHHNLWYNTTCADKLRAFRFEGRFGMARTGLKWRRQVGAPVYGVVAIATVAARELGYTR